MTEKSIMTELTEFFSVISKKIWQMTEKLLKKSRIIGHHCFAYLSDCFICFSDLFQVSNSAMWNIFLNGLSPILQLDYRAKVQTVDVGAYFVKVYGLPNFANGMFLHQIGFRSIYPHFSSMDVVCCFYDSCCRKV